VTVEPSRSLSRSEGEKEFLSPFEEEDEEVEFTVDVP
jgi:hypothetical protein